MFFGGYRRQDIKEPQPVVQVCDCLHTAMALHVYLMVATADTACLCGWSAVQLQPCPGGSFCPCNGGMCGWLAAAAVPPQVLQVGVKPPTPEAAELSGTAAVDPLAFALQHVRLQLARLVRQHHPKQAGAVPA
jgi:hypothetical protein